MKYILLMQFPVAGWEGGNLTNWKPEEIKANGDFLRSLNKDLADAGELVAVEGLGGPGQLKVVRAQANGTIAITDGPFPEAKEFLAGYWIVDVPSAERAYEIAGRLSAIPGPGGQPSNLPIEVQPIMRHCGDL